MARLKTLQRIGISSEVTFGAYEENRLAQSVGPRDFGLPLKKKIQDKKWRKLAFVRSTFFLSDFILIVHMYVYHIRGDSYLRQHAVVAGGRND